MRFIVFKDNNLFPCVLHIYIFFMLQLISPKNICHKHTCIAMHFYPNNSCIGDLTLYVYRVTVLIFHSKSYFPTFIFQRTVYDVLPPVLGNSDYVTDKEHFKTTTGTTHDYKAHGGALSNTRFKKAPGSWKVRYVEDNIGKVQCN